MNSAHIHVKEGTILGGRYQIEDRLGMGDLGNTYLCRDLDHAKSRLVAKILRTAVIHSKEADSLARKLSQLQRLRHPNLVRILDFGIVEGAEVLFLIEDLICGKDLYAGTGSMRVDEVWDLCIKLFRAIQYLHACGVVHGDLRPSNVMLAEHDNGNGKIKILDFGLMHLSRKSNQYNRNGQLAYTAPEIFLGGQETVHSDLYALGILAYQLVTRRLPFDDEDPDFLVQKHLQGDIDLRPIACLKDADRIAPWIRRMLEKDPEKRSASGMDINSCAVEAFKSDGSKTGAKDLESGFLSSGFVGRDKEMSLLRQWACQVRENGRGRTIFISGESGAGKSRCMDELRCWALIEGWRVVEGSCRACEESSYEPYRQILAKTDATNGEAIFRFGAKPITTTPGIFDTNAEFAAGQFHDLLTRELVRRLIERPTMLFLHDFHQADEATSVVLDYLSSDIQAHPVFLCVSFRPGEETKGVLAKVIDKVVRQDRGEVLTLEPLAKSSVKRLVAEMTGSRELKEILGSWIFSSVGGNPFFLEEMLKHLVEQKVLYREGGQWKILRKDLENLEVPAGVGVILQRRIAQLSPSARELVNWMSLFHRAVSMELLGAVVSRRACDIPEALGELSRRQMIQTGRKDAGETVDFNHALIAEVIRSGLPEKQRKKMHRKIAEVLEGFCSSEENLTELAMHYIEGKSQARSIRKILTAASLYRTEFAHENALRCFQYVLKNKHCLTESERCEAAIEASDTMCALGLPKRAIQLLKSEMRRNRGTEGNLTARMFMQLALGYQHVGDLYMQEICCKKGLQFARNHSNKETNLTKAMLWAELAFGKVLQSRPRKGLDYLDNALVSCPDKNAIALKGRIQNLYASLHRVACNLREARKAGERAVAILGNSDESYLACSAYSTLGFILMGLGRLSLALEQHNKAVTLSDRSRSSILKSQALGNLAECLSRMGRIPEALNIAEYAIRSVSASNNPAIIYAFNTILAEIKFNSGDYWGAHQILDQLEYHNDQNLALFTVGHALYIAAKLNYFIGGFSKALECIERLDNIEKKEAPFYEHELVEAIRARILFEQGSCQKALKTLFLLDKKVTHKHWPYHICVLKLHIAEVLVKQQKMDVAEKYAKNALRLAKTMRAMPLISRCHLLLGLIYSPLRQPVGKTNLSASTGMVNSENACIQKAVEQLQLCCNMAETVCDTDSLWLAHAELSRIYGSEGDAGNSLAHAQKAYELLGKLEDQIPSEMLPPFYAAFDRSHAKLELIRMIDAGRKLDQDPRYPIQIDDDRNARILLRISNLVNANRELNPLLQAILDQLISAMEVERAFVFLRNKSTGELDLVNGRNCRGASLFETGSTSYKISQSIYMKEEPMVSADVGRDPRLKYITTACNGLGRLLCAPLKASGRVLGVLYADHSTPVEYLSESTIDLFAAFSNLTAIAVDHALVRRQMAIDKGGVEPQYSHEQKDFAEIVGRSAPLEALRDRIGLAALSPLDILITGESGTGKELVARAIYKTGRRKSGKFIAVDCGSLSDSLAEAELFGYRKGAFTGAVENRQGLLRAAHGGIIFFDEISNMPFRLQTKLLRVLQEREVRPIGETMPRKIDIQVIAATNKDLLAEMKTGRFRSDLFYRLKVMEIRVPSLRERLEDIPLLIDWFLGKIAETENGRSKQFLPEALHLLNRYFYPGNIRELKNIVAGAYYSTTNSIIGPEELPPEVRREDAGESRLESTMASRLYRDILQGKGSFDDLVKRPFLERRLGSFVVRGVIQRALKDTGGKYRDAFMHLRIPYNRYPSVMQFLKRNKCYLDFRPFRHNHTRPDARSSL